MLVEFSVGNYRSFGERVTLSAVAGPAHREHDHAATFPATPRLSLLKSVAIYGANASGKSNLIKALDVMRGLVLTSASESQRGQPLPAEPFKLDPTKAAEPTEFEVVFVHDEKRYQYGFRFDTEGVTEEWLSVCKAAPRSRFRKLFHRTGGGKVAFGDAWRGEKGKLVALTRPNALFLSLAVQLNNDTARPPFDWFQNKLRLISEYPELLGEHFFTNTKMRDPQFKHEVVRLLQVADLGIEDVSVTQIPLADDPSWKALPDPVREALMSGAPERQTPHVDRVDTFHVAPSGIRVQFSLKDEESAGTARLYALAGPWLHVLKHGCVLLVDELDRSLHPMLSRALVEAVHGSEASQLVFTTHDVSLLDPDLMRRDQVWFTEKGQSGETRLYSLWDYTGVRKDENFRAGYLKGRYGAVPFVGALRL